MEVDHVLPEPENLTLQAASFGFRVQGVFSKLGFLICTLAPNDLTVEGLI